jgi:DNA polymerase III epsilon subunit-like protein
MYVSLDLETTGVDPKKDKIIEFGAVKFDLEGRRETLSFLINPGFVLPQIITHITKITDKDLTGQPLITSKIQEIKDFIGDLPIIGHNIQFDTSFLRNNGIELTNPEYDTFVLAGILFPNLPSYSLEILTSILDLKHKDKHRALDDSIAAMELFLKLINKFEELSVTTIEEIKSIAAKSNWQMKDLIIGINPTTEATAPLKIPKTTEKISPETKAIAKTIQDEDNSCLIEILPPYESLVKELLSTSEKNAYVCVSNELFNELSNVIPDNIAKLDSANNYISLKRLQTLEQKESLEDFEATALIKFLIWSRQTKTGILKELNLFGKEKSVLYQVNADKDFIDPFAESFVQKALQKDENAPALCTYEYLIDNQETTYENVTIVDFDKFTKEIFFNNCNFISLDSIIRPLDAIKKFYPENPSVESLISKCAILFGLLGVFFDKYNNKDSYTPRAIISQDLFSMKDWQDINSLINNLVAISQELGEINNETTFGHLHKWKEVLIELKSVFENPDLANFFMFLEMDYEQNMKIYKAPLSLKEYVNKILSTCSKYKIIDEALDLADEGTFVKTFFGLPEGLKLIRTSSKREDLQIALYKFEENQPKLVVDLIKAKKGKTAVLFNSRQQLEFFTLKLGPILEEAGINLISSLTGSIGKLEERFNQDPENSVVFMTTQIWEKFHYNEKITTLILHKIPFEAPGSLILSSLSQTLSNPFVELSTPRAAAMVKKVLNRLSAPNAEAIFLDSRIHEKDYCAQILAVSENLGQTFIQ